MRKSALEEGKRWIENPNGLPDGILANVYTSRAAVEACGIAEEVVDFVRQKISSPESSGAN